MLSKIWLRCPSILKSNATLLNSFWHFIEKPDFDDDQKVAILDIYHEFLCDLKSKASLDESINFGDFIDTLKTDIHTNSNLIFTPNKELRKILFKVIKLSYYQGLIHYTQAAEYFMTNLNEAVQEVDETKGTRF